MGAAEVLLGDTGWRKANSFRIHKGLVSCMIVCVTHDAMSQPRRNSVFAGLMSDNSAWWPDAGRCRAD